MRLDGTSLLNAGIIPMEKIHYFDPDRSSPRHSAHIHIGSPEKFPVQTPTVYFLEYPMHQLSSYPCWFLSSPLSRKRVDNGFSRPKVILRPLYPIIYLR